MGQKFCFKSWDDSDSCSVVMCCIILYIRLPNIILKRQAGRVNGRISDRVEIRTPNFQLQYLLQLYSKNLTMVLEPFTGTL